MPTERSGPALVTSLSTKWSRGEITTPLSGRAEVPFAMDLRGRVLLDHVNEGHLRVHLPGKPHGGREG